jgi:hypothetical protein
MSRDAIALLATLRTAEGDAALRAGRALVRLADEKLYLYLGRSGLAETLRAEVPSLDRRSARALESIGRIGSGADALAHLGLVRLALLGDAPAGLADSFAAAGALPLGEMRRALRSARESVQTARLRGETPTATTRPSAVAPADAATAAATARASLDELRAGYADACARTFDAARILGSLPDDAGVATRLETELGIDVAERERAAALLDAGELLTPARRAELGLSALRALAQLDPAKREPVLRKLRREGGSADAALTAIRAAETAPAETETAAAVEIVEPALLSLLFLDEHAPKGEPAFADATPYELARLLVARIPAGGSVLDLTAGTGTVARAAAALGRHARSIDILTPPLDPAVEVGDARTFDPGELRYDLVIAHPPVPLEVIYSERYAGRTLAGDLSAMDPAGYEKGIEALLATAVRAAAPDGLVAIICRESRFDGKLLDWPARIATLAERARLTPVDRLVVPARPTERAELLRRHGFAARREGRTIPVVNTVLLFRASR